MNEVSNALKVAIGEVVKECEDCKKLREQLRELRAQLSARDRMIQQKGYDPINSTREDVVVPAFGKPAITGFRKPVVWAQVQQTGFCFYCEKELSLESVTEDHFIPRSKGGKGHKSLKVLACYPCNQKKGNRMPTDAEWHKLLSRLRGARRERALRIMLEIVGEKWSSSTKTTSSSSAATEC